MSYAPTETNPLASEQPAETRAEREATKAEIMPATAVDVVVPVYKSVQLTSRCLSSLVEHIHELAGRNARLIVINDSPDDDAVRQLLASFELRYSYIVLLENERNLGFVHTVNRGLAMACKAGRDVILVNADTETFPGTLENLVRTADRDPQIGFVSPRSNNASFCSLPHFYGGKVPDPQESHRRWKELSRTMPAFHFTPTAVGFYLYIKHTVLANFGFLDPEFGLGYEEENDLILRANKAGYRAALANHAFAYHAGSASFTLLGIDLPAHQGANLKKMSQRHPEYLPLIRRYEASPHFRAERLLGSALPSSTGHLKIVFDLSFVGPSFNGTNEMSIAIIDAFYERHASRFEVNVICTLKAFKFHKLDRHEYLRRHDVDLQTSERFAIGVQLGQPFNLHAINTLEDIAVVNVFGMLDTIAEDCGYLSITHQLDLLWGHVARHASGLFFNSKFSEHVFVHRYPEAGSLSKYARLLPTRLSSYKKKANGAAGDHVLIMGNHFAHKASDATAEILKAAFPTVQFVVLGKENAVSRNLRSYRAGGLEEKQMESLYTRASIVVLPSHVEGFGMGLIHALAAGKVVVARDIPATREILATYKRYSGLFLYAHDGELAQTLRMAMNETRSRVEDDGAEGWGEWADGFAEFCSSLIDQDDLFERLSSRIRAGDLLRVTELANRLQAPAPVRPPELSQDASGKQTAPGGRVFTDDHGRNWHPMNHVKQLLSRNGEEFVFGSYVSVLNRLPDPEGLVNYLTELQSGVGKLEILTRLRNSSEGRQSRMPLAGYRRALLKKRLATLLQRPARGAEDGR